MDVLKNYINGQWVQSVSKETSDVLNPATGEILAKVPFGTATANDVAEAVLSANIAYQQWRDVPVLKRIQPLFKLKQLFEDNAEEIARIITLECGKTLAESNGEIQRAIENIEVASGAP